MAEVHPKEETPSATDRGIVEQSGITDENDIEQLGGTPDEQSGDNPGSRALRYPTDI